MDMIATELSEPYSIYTYRYFVLNWPELTYLAFYKDKMIGVVIGISKIIKNYLYFIFKNLIIKKGKLEKHAKS